MKAQQAGKRLCKGRHYLRNAKQERRRNMHNNLMAKSYIGLRAETRVSGDQNNKLMMTL